MAPGASRASTSGPSSQGSPIAKNGPTVWAGGGSGIFERGLAQDDVPAVGERPLRPGVLEVEGGDEAVAVVAGGVEDRVLREERVAREVHLGHEALGERAPEDREVDVGGPPGVVMVAPGVR